MQITALSEFDFHPQLAASSGASLVLFTSPGCGSCRHWLQLISHFSSPTVQHGYVVDVQTATALAREYEVFHLPSLFVFVDGHFHAPVHAEATPEKLALAIKTALDLPAHEEP